eukprot:GHUV01021323.1.p1 GENE.GHUV01021323.1~~GHUV01021323.1.p1  ORF type:complete len:128 (+),score=68.15 GHUV01021323.1:93-476(+)
MTVLQQHEAVGPQTASPTPQPTQFAAAAASTPAAVVADPVLSAPSNSSGSFLQQEEDAVDLQAAQATCQPAPTAVAPVPAAAASGAAAHPKFKSPSTASSSSSFLQHLQAIPYTQWHEPEWRLVLQH